MVLYKISDLVPAVFLSRPNRYLAEVLVGDRRELVHVHDPGRLKELLFEGNPCLIRYAGSATRKTEWDMIAAKKESEFVLVHSGYHRYLAEAILRSDEINPFGSFTQIRAEVKHGQSRIDFRAERSEDQQVIWVEVKGCSLSESGVAKFPDAPTVRGARHLEELIQIKESGASAGVLLLILSESQVFVPKADTDPKFAETFYRAIDAGVEIQPVKVLLQANGELVYKGKIPVGGRI